MIGSKFIPPPVASAFPAWRTQERAIAAAHQSEACLDKPNGAIAQIVRLPGAVWNTLGAEQNFGDFAIRGAVHAAVKRAQASESRCRR